MILDFAFLVITYLGGHLMIASLTALTALSFVLHKHRYRILPLLVAVGGSAATVWILKNLLKIERPGSALYLESGYSFPSGHATLAMALYGFLFLTIWKHEHHHIKNKSLFLLVLLILAIGISRIYLGVHFWQDVVAGYAIGIIWLYIASRFKNF